MRTTAFLTIPLVLAGCTRASPPPQSAPPLGQPYPVYQPQGFMAGPAPPYQAGPPPTQPAPTYSVPRPYAPAPVAAPQAAPPMQPQPAPSAVAGPASPASPPTPARKPVAAPPTTRPLSPATLPMPAARPRVVLVYDAGSDKHDPRVLDRVANAEANKLIARLYPKHLSKQSQCHIGEGGSLEQARTSGNFVPSVVSAVDGSFTAARRKQRLYLVFVGECGAVHADNWGSDELVVTENGKVIERFLTSGSSSIDRVLDLDGDGRDELVFGGGFTGQGVTESSDSLVNVGAGSLQVIKDFGQVLEDECASMLDPKHVEYSVVWATVVPGRQPQFRVEKKTRACQ